MRRLLLASSAAGLASCDQFSVSTAGHSEHEQHLDDDALDLAAYEAIRDDNLEAAVAAFAELLHRDEEDAFAAMWLGTVAVRRRDLALAERAFAHAVATVEQRMYAADANEAFAIAAKKAQLQLSLRRVRERLAPRTAAATGAGGSGLLVHTPIRRVHYSEMGQQSFEALHGTARRPVVIEGFATLAREGTPAWDLDHLRATCGHLQPPLAKYSEASASWAGMHKGEPLPSFAHYVDAIRAPGDDWASSGGGAVFDWALRHLGDGAGCAPLLDALSIPSYFSGTIVSGYGPSLFVQANGTRCGLHFDKGGTHFWQYVWQGAKRWRVFAPADWPRLFEPDAWQRAFFRDARCSGLFGGAAAASAGCDDGFGALLTDAFDDAALERLAAIDGGAPLEVFETTLRPGELLFVPAGAPHQVVNVGGPGVAMSMNYVDFTNVEEAFATLLESAELHATFRSRLNKSGVAVPGSRTRWYERFRMPVEGKEIRRMSAAGQHVAVQPPRPDAAFLEPWDAFAKRPWNLHLVHE